MLIQNNLPGQYIQPYATDMETSTSDLHSQDRFEGFQVYISLMGAMAEWLGLYAAIRNIKDGYSNVLSPTIEDTLFLNYWHAYQGRKSTTAR